MYEALGLIPTAIKSNQAATEIEYSGLGCVPEMYWTLGQCPALHWVSQAWTGMIPEYRAKNKPWILPGIAPKPITKYNDQLKKPCSSTCLEAGPLPWSSQSHTHQFSTRAIIKCGEFPRVFDLPSDLQPEDPVLCLQLCEDQFDLSSWSKQGVPSQDFTVGFRSWFGSQES